MFFLYPFLLSFIFIFLSELGDKTQILVLSFSTKNKVSNILFGVALGSLFSHGFAIAFGSKIGSFNNDMFIFYIKVLTYFTFLLFGFFGFMHLKKSSNNDENDSASSTKSKFLKFFASLSKNCTFLVATSIAIGELGDKTFLASLGLGIQYPVFKFSLICGSVCGMVVSNSIAIFFGKWLGSKFSSYTVELLSNIIFVLFGIFGLLSIFLI